MIRLVGAPTHVLVDTHAVDAEVERQLVRLGLPVVRLGDHGPTLGGACVAIFGRDHPVVPECWAWFVGPGPTPAWMRATDGLGPPTAAKVLARLATAFEQERAGFAFRAAGAGLPQPAQGVLDPQLLEGVSRAVAPLVPATELLLRQSFEAIERCCADSGAITAAPRGAPGEPDYWFTWQRDAAAVGFALQALAERGPDDLRHRARRRLAAYVAFVEGFEGDLSASRRTVSGQVVGGYGDPQHDGPAATALLLYAVAPAAAGRFVQHLLDVGDGPGYDLWELNHGRAFHASNLRRRALVRAGIACKVGSPPTDASVVGSTVLGFERERDDLDAPARVVGPLEEAAQRWPVNARWRMHHQHGAGIGRFPDDANDGLRSSGGGPWPVCTLWTAQYYRAVGLHEKADGLLAFVLAHVDPSSITEQLHPVTGQPRGANGLAWAHAELITTLLQVTHDRHEPPPPGRPSGLPISRRG